jgi:precorrin-6B methylase 2
MDYQVNQATIDYIRQHADDDVRKLALQGNRFPEVDLTYALEQIAGRQKARIKLPSWAVLDGIIYPSHLSMEQCSSEATARYKASIAGTGNLLVDLTAGFGVDVAFVSPNFNQAVSVEQKASLCTISSENFSRLGLKHVKVICGDGVDYLHQMDHADLLFIDPARRDEHGGRTYGIADCSPNVLEIIDEMIEKASRVMIKLSPMLDWRKAVDDIGGHRANVNEVHIVSVNNECKELLLVVSKEATPVHVFCVNDTDVFDFEAGNHLPTEFLSVEQSPHYLYEPNASIMKAGAFDLVANRFGITQVGKNSHLFVSDTPLSSFPGRCFVIDNIVSMNKREVKQALKDVSRANISVRNFPMSVAELRRRLKLKDGGDVYLFATTVERRGHQLFVCRKTE